MALSGYFLTGVWPHKDRGQANVTEMSEHGRQKGVRKKIVTDEEETNKPAYAPELLEHLRALNDESLSSRTWQQQGGLGEDELRKLSDEAAMAGSLTIALSRQESESESRPPIFFDELEGGEWVALFRDVLGCPVGIEVPRSQDEDINERVKRFRAEFQRKTKDYPLLGRMTSPYADVSYTPAEVFRLRDECLKVRLHAASHEEAIAGVDKLKNACDEAIKSGSGIELMCD